MGGHKPLPKGKKHGIVYPMIIKVFSGGGNHFVTECIFGEVAI